MRARMPDARWNYLRLSGRSGTLGATRDTRRVPISSLTAASWSGSRPGNDAAHDFKIEEEELLEMRRQQKLRLAGTVAALLTAAFALCVFGWAQGGDTPIVISDGSLNIRSEVPWSLYTGTGDIKSHPHSTKSATSVAFTVGGKDQTIAFAGESCRVDITYAGAHIVFNTGTDGKGFMMRPYSAFHQGSTANFLAHNNANAKISHVTIIRSEEHTSELQSL